MCLQKRIIVQQQRLVLNEKTHCSCMKQKRPKTKVERQNTYDLTGEFGIGYTTKGEPFWFDLEDYDKIKPYCCSQRGYVITTVPKDSNLPKTPMLHNIIMSPPKGMNVDHKQHPEGINAHKMDNRKENLRLVTTKQNCQNRGMRRDNTTGHVGVLQSSNVMENEKLKNSDSTNLTKHVNGKKK